MRIWIDQVENGYIAEVGSENMYDEQKWVFANVRDLLLFLGSQFHWHPEEMNVWYKAEDKDLKEEKYNVR